jgi:hypothetical protein
MDSDFSWKQFFINFVDQFIVIQISFLWLKF